MSNIIETVREVFALRRNGYSGPFFQGMLLFLVGMWLLLPWDTFPTADTYDLMSQYASEEFWGVAMVLTSLVIISSSLSRWPREVALGALVAGSMWFVIFGSFVSANPPSTLVPISFWAILRNISLFREFRTQFDPQTGAPLEHTHHFYERKPR